MSPVGETERVSTRELRENAFRALRAAGVSAGEATAAADAVVEAETQGWDGLHALMREIGTSAQQALARGGTGGKSVVPPSGGRGPLLLGLGACDTARAQAARGAPVRAFVDGIECHPAHLCFALRHAQRACRTTLLAGVDEAGATARAWTCDSLGNVRVPDDHAALTGINALLLHNGLHIVDHPAGLREGSVVSTPDERAQRRDRAVRDGLAVPRDVWASVQCAARRFLVPEQANTTAGQG